MSTLPTSRSRPDTGADWPTQNLSLQSQDTVRRAPALALAAASEPERRMHQAGHAASALAACMRPRGAARPCTPGSVLVTCEH